MLILDEPLAALDLRNQREIVALLARLNAELGVTILVVAHDLNPLLTVLDSAIYLLDGHAHYAAIDDVVDEELLTHLYGTRMEVVHTPQGEMYMRSVVMTTTVVALGYQQNWWQILTSPFMRNALIGGTLVALAAGLIGYFIVVRSTAFAAHALAHIGLPGATGAVLLGLPVASVSACSASAARWSSARSGSGRRPRGGHRHRAGVRDRARPVLQLAGHQELAAR